MVLQQVLDKACRDCVAEVGIWVGTPAPSKVPNGFRFIFNVFADIDDDLPARVRLSVWSRFAGQDLFSSTNAFQKRRHVRPKSNVRFGSKADISICQWQSAFRRPQS